MTGRVSPALGAMSNSQEMQNMGSRGSDYPYEGSEDGAETQRSINRSFRQLPSRSAQRSLHNASTRRRGSISRRSMRPTQDVEVINIEDYIDGEDDMASPKELAQPMSAKRRYKRSMRNMKAQKRISRWKAFKLRVAMYWQSTTSSVSEWSQDIELWKGHLKEVEGRFGNGVLSFFLFLKWLLFLNLIIFLLEFGLISLPAVIIKNSATQVNTSSCDITALEAQSVSNGVANKVLDFVTGQGWINTTLMFYAGYPAAELLSEDDVKYDLPLAYLLVGGAYFFGSLLLMVRNLAKSFQQSYIEGGGTTSSFCNKVFAAWDYCISDENTAKIKSQSIVQIVKAELAEEERLVKVQNRTTGDKCRLYTLRFFTNLLVTSLLGGAVYAIIKIVNVSTNSSHQNAAAEINEFLVTVLNFSPSLTITFLNFILPLLFNALSNVEDWSPRFEVNINLFRTVLLRLASIAVLMITLYVDVETRCDEDQKKCCQQNWENQIASQMYMLIWIDFFLHIAVSLVGTTVWRLLYKYTSFFKRFGLPEFDIPKQVLQLVYGECLIWIGTFFSPLLPAMGVVKLFLVFYIEKVALMFNNKPSDKVYQGTRSNYLFTVLLLISFLMCLIAVGWGITRVRPSCQGPFSNSDCNPDKRIFDVLSTEIDSWPQAIQEIIRYIGTAAFIFPVLMVICLILYYFRSMSKSHLHMIEMLKDQLVLEGRDKRFLMEKLMEGDKPAGDLDDDTSSGETQHTSLRPSSNAQF
ncbi:transmembrane channel-like protein 7 [Stylophora pistillata]|uniref:Transmembrane channel-like protein 7 n=1 Tax=Stylophora pistillata TaxID=50429 RepID=A0A2B4RZA1_STYPI|nr:transmembrane channel-like protein 7 [Stylophora pistillata]PFX22961.1 Transmembrane channel-like protein 7 [Stylophora pistillata]